MGVSSEDANDMEYRTWFSHSCLADDAILNVHCFSCSYENEDDANYGNYENTTFYMIGINGAAAPRQKDEHNTIVVGSVD